MWYGLFDMNIFLVTFKRNGNMHLPCGVPGSRDFIVVPYRT